MKNIAVILAGGAGKRFGADRPKQLLPLEDGRTVLEHAIAVFRACNCIDEVLVVMHPDWIGAPMLSPLKEENIAFVAGGSERWESSWNAISYITSLLTPPSSVLNPQSSPRVEANLLIHDAARPFVSQRIIEDVCEALEQHEAVTVAIPATDTMYRVETTVLDDGDKGQSKVVEIPNRASMMRAQTPQAFRLSLIKRAYELALQDPNLQATDDCGIVHRYLPDTPIYIVAGEEANRKITFKEDLYPPKTHVVWK